MNDFSICPNCKKEHFCYCTKKQREFSLFKHEKMKYVFICTDCGYYLVLDYLGFSHNYDGGITYRIPSEDYPGVLKRGILNAQELIEFRNNYKIELLEFKTSKNTSSFENWTVKKVTLEKL